MPLSPSMTTTIRPDAASGRPSTATAANVALFFVRTISRQPARYAPFAGSETASLRCVATRMRGRADSTSSSPVSDSYTPRLTSVRFAGPRTPAARIRATIASRTAVRAFESLACASRNS